MIPVTSITQQQHGQQVDLTLPPIKLGTSLARAAGESLTSIRPTIHQTTRSSRRQSYRRVHIARRVSDILNNLSKVSEGVESAQRRQQRVGEEGGTRELNLTDLRRRRRQLQQGISVRSNTEEELHHRKNTEKFKKLVNRVVVIVRICLSAKSYMKEEANPNWSLMEMTLSVQEHFDRLLSFRPADTWKLPSQNGRLEIILRIPPPFRSADHIRTIKGLMRGHTAFEDYPDHIQDELSAVMHYQRYESRRVITRLGHHPTAFYMILSGVVLVNIPDTNVRNGQTFTRTVNELSRGDIFGEVALITNSTRNATIICKTDTELVVISDDDFNRIIKAPLVRQIDSHLMYVRTLELFRYFPCEALKDKPHDFFYQYFKPDSVVINNSVETNYLVIIMSGKCRAVCAFSPPKKAPLDESARLLKNALELEFPVYTDKLKRHKIKMQRVNIGDLDNMAALEFNIKSQEVDVVEPLVTEFNHKFPPSVQSSEYNRSQRRRSSSMTGFYEVVEKEKVKNPNLWSSRLSQTMRAVTEEGQGYATPLNTISEQRADQNNMTQSWKRLATNAVRLKSLQIEGDSEPLKYAQLAEFHEGNVFGLETLLQKDMAPVLSLVSDGAECIFVSKKLFMENANAKVFRLVSDLVVAYPSTEFIDNYIKRQNRWKDFKMSLVGKRSRLLYTS